MAAAASAAAHARPARRRAALHRLLRRRLVHRQRVPGDLVGRRPAAAARGRLPAGRRRPRAAAARRHRRRAGPRRRAHRDAGLHRRLLLDPALARRVARPPARRGRRRAGRSPRARDLAHRLPLELRPRATRAACCSPRTSAASRSPTATARRAASSPRGGAGFSGSSGSSASRSTRIPTRAPSPRRCGAASPPRGAARPDRTSTAVGKRRGGTLSAIRRRVAPVDRVGVDERAAVLGKRSIKADSQQQAIRIAISMVDLTTLEGQDTPGKVAQLARQGGLPGARAAPRSRRARRSACTPRGWPTPAGARRLRRRRRVASPPAFRPASHRWSSSSRRPARRSPQGHGDRHGDPARRLPGGRRRRVVEEVEQVKEACGSAHLKVILEIDELGGYDHVRHASLLAIAGGGGLRQDLDRQGRRAPPRARAGDARGGPRLRPAAPGKVVGVKAAGGVSTTKQAIHMLVLVKETLGDDWLHPTASASAPRRCSTTCSCSTSTGPPAATSGPEDFCKE